MKAEIMSSRILHRVKFAPNPTNPAFPTPPQIVGTRLVRDIEEFPQGVNYISFDDVVETEIRIGSRTGKVHSQPFNESTYFVMRDDGSTWVNRHLHYKIEVHPDLKGKLWVFGDATQSEDQRVA